MWQSGRILSLQFLLLFPIKQLTDQFITHWSDKERNTGRHIRATGGAGLDVWLPEWSTSVINRKLNSSLNKILKGFESEQGHQTKDLTCWVQMLWNVILGDALECVSLMWPHYWGSGFIITPQIQVFTYLMETTSHFRALNKNWQKHPRTTEKTKATNNKQQGCRWPVLSRPGGMYFLCRVTCLTHIPLWWLGWPVHTEWCADLPACTATSQSSYGHEDDLISGNGALVLSAYV